MIENKNQPAFPISEEATDRAVDGVTIFTGVTKLEFFACNAPNEIPAWFVHTPPEQVPVQQPSFDDLVNDDDKELCRSWLRDPCFDLPDYLKWFQDKTEQANAAYSENNRQDRVARYFQWRRFYAEQLLTELSKTQP